MHLRSKLTNVKQQNKIQFNFIPATIFHQTDTDLTTNH